MICHAPTCRALAAVTILVLASAVPAWPCHVPEHLRNIGLTPEQLAAVAHGGEHPEQIPYSLAAAQACVGGQADIFSCRDVDLLAHRQLSDIGGGNGNDLWGWVDPLTDREYALVGRSNGTAFVDVTDPENPIYVGNLPTHSGTSTWRDIKAYADHAYIVSDFNGAHGVQVFDLTQLRTATPGTTFSETAHYDQVASCHNIAINEDTGFAYAVGCSQDSCSDGGLHMIDLRTPTQPTFAGCFDADGYTHDAQCVTYQGPDVEHQGREICFASNVDTVTVVDVTDKANPVQLSRTGYDGRAYTHQGWLTDDHRYFVHDDEADEMQFGHNTRTYVWDMSDLDAPEVTGHFTAAGPAIDHNQYVRGEFTFQANYRRGLRILRLVDPATAELEEVAFFDTYPEGDTNQFGGAWSVYPYFPSGTVVVSDMGRGLFVLQPSLGPVSIFSDGFETGDTSAWSQSAGD